MKSIKELIKSAYRVNIAADSKEESYAFIEEFLKQNPDYKLSDATNTQHVIENEKTDIHNKFVFSISEQERKVTVYYFMEVSDDDLKSERWERFSEPIVSLSNVEF